jgi:hypothetical protein
MTPDERDAVAALLNRNRELVDVLASSVGDSEAVISARDEWYTIT